LLENIFERSKVDMANDNYLGLDTLKSIESELGEKIR